MRREGRAVGPPAGGTRVKSRASIFTDRKYQWPRFAKPRHLCLVLLCEGSQCSLPGPPPSSAHDERKLVGEEQA